MFHSARLRLTTWYVLLILSLTSLVSVFVFVGINQELTRIEHIQQRMTARPTPYIIPLPGSNQADKFVAVTDEVDIAEIRRRIIVSIIGINAGIGLIIGAISYFLAGKTLQPIQNMVDEQRRFLADASHELRTPLTSLRTATEVSLRDKGLKLTEAKTLLKDNLDEIKNLQYLSEGLLRLSAFEKKEVDLVMESVAIDQVIKEAVKKVTAQAGLKKIKVKVSVDKTFVKGDRLALVEVVVILLDNAIKYSPRNTVITVSSQKKRSTVKIVIQDQGIGIASKDMPHIFDRFYRADESRSSTFGTGYGLGLPIAQRIVEQHAGRITVMSYPTQGSTFYVELPVS